MNNHTSTESTSQFDICIIGGAGHIGLPLGIAFANTGLKVALLDINKETLEKIDSGVVPFKEDDGDNQLNKALQSGNLKTSANPKTIQDSKIVIMVIGTPIDEYLNPNFHDVMRTVDSYFDYFQDGQILILRSTVYPGTSERIQNYFKEKNKVVHVAFCPERIVEGKAFEEFKNLPQIVSAFDSQALARVTKLFGRLTKKVIIPVEPIEAELSKLFCNTWRYLQFAISNQFFMIAEKYNLDYRKIYEAMTKDYERLEDLATPGFSAGPCLLKDTMQLSAFNNSEFMLGQAAMNINEGLPKFVIEQLKQKHGENLKNKKIGILGMTFKSESDDIRDSLSFKLRKVGAMECRDVFCHDFYHESDKFFDLDYVLQNSDIVILATPHKGYKDIDIHKYEDKEFVDIWHFWQKN
jgi:UDP-N-acetyl-D-mannosaminuronic acid dehydrogenase